MPMRKVGSETPIREIVISACDRKVPRRSAAKTPIGTPTTSAMTAASSESSSVAGKPLGDERRDLAALAQAQPEFALHGVADEVGELDRERAGRGRGRSAVAGVAAGVASWPRMFVTGSPTYWNSMKAMKATVSMTRTAWTSRRRTKASMGPVETAPQRERSAARRRARAAHGEHEPRRHDRFVARHAMRAKRAPRVKGVFPRERTSQARRRKGRPKAAFCNWIGNSREASVGSEEVTNAELEALRGAASRRRSGDRGAAGDCETRVVAVVERRRSCRTSPSAWTGCTGTSPWLATRCSVVEHADVLVSLLRS